MKKQTENNEEMGKKKTEKKISVTYTIRAYKANAEKLKKAKMITEEEETILQEIHQKMLNRWISLEMGI